MAHDVFVSYSSKDSVIANAVLGTLEGGRYGEQIRCWIAYRDARAGEWWADDIINAINKAKIMVVILSGNCNRSRHVRSEVDRAVSQGVIIIPFRIEDVEPAGALAFYLAGLHWLDALTPPREEQLAKLFKRVKANLEQQHTESVTDGSEPHSQAAAFPSDSKPDAVFSPELQREPLLVSSELPSQSAPPPPERHVGHDVAPTKSRRIAPIIYGLIALTALVAFILFIVRPGGDSVSQQLLRAAKNGDLQRVQNALSMGADVNVNEKDAFGWTPLNYAADRGHLEIAKLLLEKGANVNAKNRDPGFTALMGAAYMGHLEVVKLLLAKGADVNARDNQGSTALMDVAVSGWYDSENVRLGVAELLLEKGADPKVKDDEGKTALDIAIEHRKTVVVKLLKARSPHNR